MVFFCLTFILCAMGRPLLYRYLVGKIACIGSFTLDETLNRCKRKTVLSGIRSNVFSVDWNLNVVPHKTDKTREYFWNSITSRKCRYKYKGIYDYFTLYLLRRKQNCYVKMNVFHGSFPPRYLENSKNYKWKIISSNALKRNYQKPTIEIDDRSEISGGKVMNRQKNSKQQNRYTARYA